VVSRCTFRTCSAWAIASWIFADAVSAGILSMDHSPTFKEPTKPVILDLGRLSGGANNSYATAISADGKWVVGSASHGNYSMVAFRWTLETGMVSLDQSFFARPDASADAVNCDGSVIVGSRDSERNSLARAFRWTREGGMVMLGVLPGSDRSAANAVSADGRVVVGNSGGAFRWTEQAGMVALPGRTMFGARAVSADGRMVFGDEMSADGIHLVRWDVDGHITRYPNPDGVSASFVTAVTPDGSIAVGEQHMKGAGPYDGAVRAVAWFSPTRIVQLGFFHGGNYSKATAVNSDGTVIVGVANSSTVFRWTPSRGMEALTDWIEKAGGDSPPPSYPISASGVSGDGLRVVGTLANRDAYVAIVPRH
jgi:uncharacterized membrane protein